MANLLELRHVSKTYSRGLINAKSTVALQDISLTLKEDEPTIMTVAGESGSGKTTLAMLLLGFITPTTGQIIYRGKDITTLEGEDRLAFRREVQAVFQDPFAVFNPFYTVDHLLTVPIKQFKLAKTPAEARAKMDEALKAVGLRPEDVLGRFPHQLSGGQRQRINVARALLLEQDGVAADEVIMDADRARAAGLTSTVIVPVGNLAPQGSVVKATAIDSSVIDADGVYRHRGRARVFTSERAAIQAVKGQTQPPVQPGDIMVLIGIGPQGTGMVETAQITSALKYLEWGKQVTLLTDGRFSGFSTGACIGHIGPEALAGGAIGKVRDGDWIEVILDRHQLEGTIRLVGTVDGLLTADAAQALLDSREPHPDLHQHPRLPDDTRLWAALQEASGGTWAGCVYDVDKIITVLKAGLNALQAETER
jgi:ABC-type dipeptide/oligopeptide/nickel transport system ATPase subunit